MFSRGILATRGSPYLSKATRSNASPQHKSLRSGFRRRARCIYVYARKRDRRFHPLRPSYSDETRFVTYATSRLEFSTQSFSGFAYVIFSGEGKDSCERRLATHSLPFPLPLPNNVEKASPWDACAFILDLPRSANRESITIKFVGGGIRRKCCFPRKMGRFGGEGTTLTSLKGGVERERKRAIKDGEYDVLA